ncbi:MAG: SGNH/GDSL hydrolase family protein [Pyrinomonadaceae bacterium]|nr:SGNH/GDSL hydrolase family protein [Pyrinomonadaceae bacterium]
MSLKKWQTKYYLGGLAVSPLIPFLYAQGKFVRYKVGRLPDAAGEPTGSIGDSEETVKLLAIGESTVAGIGAKEHAEAFTGQFAKHLSRKLGKTVEWHALGESGITVRRTLVELVPRIPAENFDVIAVALGGNDVFGLSSPKKFRRDFGEFLSVLREKFPQAEIIAANVPMVRDFIAMPNPLRYVLSRLAKLHHFNARDLIENLEKTTYFYDVKRVNDDFFSDGIHPSVNGYDLWTEEMVEFFLKNR